ncbi:MAG: GNAT family N-acetyltransferase [Anaerolineales bacterium]
MKPDILCINTTRLTLRPLQEKDAETLYRIYQTDGVLRYFPNPVPPPLEKVQRFITGQQAHWQKHGYGNWGIMLEGASEIIGWAGLQYLPELEEIEVGFLLGRPFWGKGYASEAAHASLQSGFNRFKLGYIIALVHPENLASRRVIEKCGLTYQDILALWGIKLMRYQIKRPYLVRNKPDDP